MKSNPPHFHQLVIDKVTLTLGVAPGRQERVINKLQTSLYSTKPYRKFDNYKKTKLFLIPAKLTGHHDEFLMVQAQPFQEETLSFLRVDFNPAKVGSGGIAYVKAIINSLVPGGYQALVNQGKVTRLDVAVDIQNLRLQDLMVYAVAKRQSDLVQRHLDANGHDCRLEFLTHYLGSRRSDEYFCVYSKSLELGLKDEDRTRFEVRLRNNYLRSVVASGAKISSLAELCNLRNPFPSLEVHDFSQTLVLKGSLVMLFLDSCRYRGLHAALRQLSSRDRDKVRRLILPKIRSDWWHPDEWWAEHWSKVLLALVGS